MKINWTALKQLYVEGPEISLNDLAEKHKVKPQTMRLRAAKEGWTEQRKLFQAKVQNLRTEKRSEILASESAQFDSDCLKIARAALGKIVQELKGDTPADKSMSALEKAQKVGRLAMGEQSQDSEVTIKVVYDGVQGTAENSTP